MIDVKDLRENPEKYKEVLKKKFRDPVIVDEVLKLDEEWRELKLDSDKLRSERNKISEEINKAKKTKDEKRAKELIEQAKKIPDKLKKLEESEGKAYEKLKFGLWKIPNIISDKVPIGKDESENVVEKVIGKPKKKNFPVKSHIEIAEELGVADFESSSRVAGAGFYYLEGDLALLNQALIRFTIDKMLKEGFEYVETPLILNNDIIDRVTDLNDQEIMIYRLGNEDKSLIGTSEHSLIGRYVDQEIDPNELPIMQASYSMCFRKEVGSHGIDEKGIFRTHQFNKVEMVAICMPEDSDKFFKKMNEISISIMKDLKIPIRVLRICSGDLGDLKYEQIDLEAYSPRKKGYFEITSCSNLTDAQARKLGISTIIKNKRIIPHTLNNTAIATSRIMVAILENFQNKDGSVSIPKVLQKYMNGKKKIDRKKKKST